MSGVEKGVTIFLGGLIAVAIATTVFSKKNQTPQVLSAAGTATSQALSAAEGNPIA